MDGVQEQKPPNHSQSIYHLARVSRHRDGYDLPAAMPYGPRGGKTHLRKFRLPTSRICHCHASLCVAFNANLGRRESVLFDRPPEELPKDLHH